MIKHVEDLFRNQEIRQSFNLHFQVVWPIYPWEYSESCKLSFLNPDWFWMIILLSSRKLMSLAYITFLPSFDKIHNRETDQLLLKHKWSSVLYRGMTLAIYQFLRGKKHLQIKTNSNCTLMEMWLMISTTLVPQLLCYQDLGQNFFTS